MVRRNGGGRGESLEARTKPSARSKTISGGFVTNSKGSLGWSEGRTRSIARFAALIRRNSIGALLGASGRARPAAKHAKFRAVGVVELHRSHRVDQLCAHREPTFIGQKRAGAHVDTRLPAMLHHHT